MLYTHQQSVHFLYSYVVVFMAKLLVYVCDLCHITVILAVAENCCCNTDFTLSMKKIITMKQ